MIKVSMSQESIRVNIDKEYTLLFKGDATMLSLYTGCYIRIHDPNYPNHIIWAKVNQGGIVNDNHIEIITDLGKFIYTRDTMPDVYKKNYEDYIGKYIQLPVLPMHLGGYIWAKVIGVSCREEDLVFNTREGFSSFKYGYLPKKYEKMD